MSTVDKVAAYFGVDEEELATSDAEVIARGRVAAAEIDASAERGESHLSVRLPGEVHKALRAWAEESGETTSALLRRVIGEALNRRAHPDVASLDAAIDALQARRASTR